MALLWEAENNVRSLFGILEFELGHQSRLQASALRAGFKRGMDDGGSSL